MRRVAIAAAAALLVAACQDEATALRALRVQGFTDVVLTGYAWSGCGRDDTFHTGFRAKAANGETVEGVVCSGYWKGSTVRVF